MNKILCWLIHDWSQWSAPKEEQHTITYNPRSFGRRSYIRTSLTQGRSCYRCGKVQERIIRVLGERPELDNEEAVF